MIPATPLEFLVLAGCIAVGVLLALVAAKRIK